MKIITLNIHSINFIPCSDGLIQSRKNSSISDISSYTHKLSKPKLFNNKNLKQLQKFADNDIRCSNTEFNPVLYVWCRDTINDSVSKINIHNQDIDHNVTLSFDENFVPSNNRNPILFYLVTKYTEEYMGVSGISGQCWVTWDKIFDAIESNTDISIPVYKVLTDDETRIRGNIVLKNIEYSGTHVYTNENTISDSVILKDGWLTEASIFQTGGLSPYDDDHRVTHSIIYVTGGRMITAAPYYVHIQPRNIDPKLLIDLLKLGCTMMKLPFNNIPLKISIIKKRLYAIAFAQGVSLLGKLCYYRTDTARYINQEHIGCTTDDDLWSDVGLTGSGDCEDMSKFLFSLVCSVCDYNGRNSLLLVAKEIFNMYIPFMMHGGVTVGSASKMDDSNNDGYTSHMFTLLIPRHRFWKSLYYGSKNGIEQQSNIKLYEHSSMVDIERLDTLIQSTSDDSMPVLILEGTGYLDPTVIPIGLIPGLLKKDIDKYQYIYDKESNIHNNLLGGIGFQCRPDMDLLSLMNQKRCSRFYKSIVSCMTHRRFTDSFVKDGNVLTSFVFHDIGRTYGIPITYFLLYYGSIIDDLPQLIQPLSTTEYDGTSRCFNPTSHIFCVPSSIRTKKMFDNTSDLLQSWVIPPSSILSNKNTYESLEFVLDIQVITDGLDDILQNIISSKQKNLFITRYNPTMIKNIMNDHDIKKSNIYVYPLSKFQTSNIETNILLVIY